MEMERASKQMETSGGSSYDVFLSFYGDDTRTTFTDHLYLNLTDAGVCTFRDNEELRVGKTIGPELLSAIEHSKIFIPIFSTNYASSKWCLQELTHMVNCIKEEDAEHTIFPIFYGVKPSEVRKQKGAFGTGFNQHEEDPQFPEWERALKEVPDSKGFEREKISNGHEGELVRQVVSEVVLKLKKNNVDVPEADTLVGMERRVRILRKFLAEDCTQVRNIGIHGMGGIGKTTVAKFIYNEFCESFEQRCCFIENVRETEKQPGGLERIQDKIITAILRRRTGQTIFSKDSFKNMKVFIVLDDVHEDSKLKEFFGKQSGYLLGSGSKIIITSRSKDLLRACGVGDSEIYRLEGMNDVDSLHLFCKHAFGSQDPNEGYEDISKDVVISCHGLPLSLVVVGSHLRNKTMEIWEETSEKLKTLPDDKVLSTLRISYDALTFRQKEIFLDIACHFIGPYWVTSSPYAFYMWKDKEWFPKVETDRLASLSLVKVEDDTFTMHDLLIDLGREIVREKSCDDIGERSRVWDHEDAIDILYTNQGTKRVQTLHVEFQHEEDAPFNCLSNEMFKGLSNLRYLQLWNSNLKGDFNRLLPNLRWLKWVCDDSQTPLVNFRLDKLVILDLSGSSIPDGWEDWMQIKVATNLKVLQMSFCSKITRTPNFSTLKKLEILNFSGSRKIREIHPSIWKLDLLVMLDLTCTRVAEVSEDIQNLKSLRKLNLSETLIKVLPEAIGNLKNLRVLDISECCQVECLPNTIRMLKHLAELKARFCSSLAELPESIGDLNSLTEMNISCSKVRRLPDGIGMLRKLEEFRLDCCASLEALPDTIGNLSNLRILILTDSAITKLPVEIENLQKLEILDCTKSSLEGEIPRGIWSLPSLRELSLALTGISSIPANISGLSSLLQLDLRNCHKLQLPPELILPSNLRHLDCIPSTIASLASIVSLVNLTSLHFAYQCERVADVNEHPGDMSKLSKLRNLEVVGLDNIVGLNALYELETLTFGKCKTLRCFPDMSNLKMLRKLSIYDCPEMTEIGDLSKLESLKELQLSSCDSVERMPDLSDLISLKLLTIRHFKKLYEMNGVGGLISLETWEMTKCPSLKGLLDLSNLKKLQHFVIYDCQKLREINGLESLTSLKSLELVNCPITLDNLPDLSNLKLLKEKRIEPCEESTLPQQLMMNHQATNDARDEVEFPPAAEFRNIKFTPTDESATSNDFMNSASARVAQSKSGWCCFL